MEDRARALIIETLTDLNGIWQLEPLKDPDGETRLWGAKSGLDSMMLVTLIAELETRCSETFGKDLILADERAMSQTRSPFRRVDSLAAYLAEQLAADA